jgi:hypothetical protein
MYTGPTLGMHVYWSHMQCDYSILPRSKGWLDPNVPAILVCLRLFPTELKGNLKLVRIGITACVR